MHRLGSSYPLTSIGFSHSFPKKRQSWLARHEVTHIRKWGSWLASRDVTLIRRLLGWASAALYWREFALASECRFRGSAWTWRRLGGPLRKWEAPMVGASGGWLGEHSLVAAREPAECSAGTTSPVVYSFVLLVWSRVACSSPFLRHSRARGALRPFRAASSATSYSERRAPPCHHIRAALSRASGTDNATLQRRRVSAGAEARPYWPEGVFRPSEARRCNMPLLRWYVGQGGAECISFPLTGRLTDLDAQDKTQAMTQGIQLYIADAGGHRRRLEL